MEKPRIEGFEVRELKTDAEVDKCIDLQREIWGLDELGRMSPLTLKSLISDNPKMAIISGGFLNNEMIAIQITLPTMEPYTVYEHMLGIIEKYRDLNIGYFMLKHLYEILKKQQIKKIMWTYEPLEGRNANNYLNKSGANAVKYLQDYYHVVNDMSDGMPIDRFRAEVNFDDDFQPQKTYLTELVLTLEEAIKKIPIASADFMPEADQVLIEIPEDLQSLKTVNMDLAIKFRFDTRKIFIEYINKRQFVAVHLYTGIIDGQRKNYYLVQKTNK
jgi:predicted GNAT superfamily acetyltransferase